MGGTSVYLHFPWCLKKCPYCDFASAGIARAEVPHARYAEAILAELEAKRPLLEGRTLVSVFFGGGTPSLWAAEEIARVLEAVRASFASVASVAEDLEVTLECNPTSLDEPKARALVEAGVDRLSVGVQSLDRGRLRFLGRLHDEDGALRALRVARSVAPRSSADLIFGNPNQRAEEVVAELEGVLALGMDHLSVYALTIEPETQFGALHKKGKLPLAKEEAVAESYLAAERLLEERGLVHYEVSNYARPGEESRHNAHYWRGGDYLGLGAGAVGCLSEDRRGSPSRHSRRAKNETRPERYMEAIESGAPPSSVEVYEETLSPEMRVQEALMLGLRTAEGVDLRAVEESTGIDPLRGRERALERHAESLIVESDRLRARPASWLFLDGIVADLF